MQRDSSLHWGHLHRFTSRADEAIKQGLEQHLKRKSCVIFISKALPNFYTNQWSNKIWPGKKFLQNLILSNWHSENEVLDLLKVTSSLWKNTRIWASSKSYTKTHTHTPVWTLILRQNLLLEVPNVRQVPSWISEEPLVLLDVPLRWWWLAWQTVPCWVDLQTKLGRTAGVRVFHNEYMRNVLYSLFIKQTFVISLHSLFHTQILKSA